MSILLNKKLSALTPFWPFFMLVIDLIRNAYEDFHRCVQNLKDKIKIKPFTLFFVEDTFVEVTFISLL